MALFLGMVAILRPWAVAALREGTPDEVWPADGRFSAHLDQPTSRPPSAVSNQVTSTPAFDQAFVESGGSGLIVASGAGGDIVHVRFTEPHDPTTEFNSFSMAKSLVGVLVLKSISDGQLAGLDVTAADIWPETAHTEVASVTVRELMDMRSGLAFEKPRGSAGDSEVAKKDNALAYSPASNLARLHVDGLEAVIDDIALIEGDRGRYS